MEKTTDNFYDFIVIGSGMGGMTAASLLANDGCKVLVIEAAHALGGCSSSYYRKGYTFESGATTLIGFDENQPLKKLEDHLGITIPKTPLNPSMKVHMGDKVITRWQDRERWMKEVVNHFGEDAEQRKFWETALRISDVVWRVSGKNNFFPPLNIKDWVKLFKNDPRDVWVLPHALKSVRETAIKFGITNVEFFRFLDEQLMISSQSDSNETPFLFGSPALTYTNYSNYYVPGGLINMVHVLRDFILEKGGEVHNKEKVLHVDQTGSTYIVQTSKKRVYKAPVVISNIPIWNMGDITGGKMKEYFDTESEKFDDAWGAFTMGVVTDDVYPEDMPHHHQIHLDDADKSKAIYSDSVFVSFSEKNDAERAPKGDRVLNVSTHANTDFWFGLNGCYDKIKADAQEQILEILKNKLPYFKDSKVKLAFSATPVSWSNWVYRKKGRVGGIPQSMTRSLFDWTDTKTPFKGLYLCGDTVFPGQGIPGVTLSGFNVYYRVQRNYKKLLNH